MFPAPGLDSEGLYRVAGFHDDVEAIRMSFDKGRYTLICLFINNMYKGHVYVSENVRYVYQTMWDSFMPFQ